MLPFKLIKDTPYLALSGELWSVFNEYFNINWSCYRGFLLYIYIYIHISPHYVVVLSNLMTICGHFDPMKVNWFRITWCTNIIVILIIQFSSNTTFRVLMGFIFKYWSLIKWITCWLSAWWLQGPGHQQACNKKYILNPYISCSASQCWAGIHWIANQEMRIWSIL